MRKTSLEMSVRVCVRVDMVKEKLGKHRGGNASVRNTKITLSREDSSFREVMKAREFF